MGILPKLSLSLATVFIFLILKFFLFFTFAQEEISKSSPIFFVKINDNGFEFEIQSKKNKVKELLTSQGIEIHPEDLIFPSLEEDLLPEMKIIIKRALPVFVETHGKKEKIYTRTKTVEEFLKENKIELKEDEIINQKLQEEIFPQMEIKITKKPPLKKDFQIGLASWYSFVPGDFAASRFFKKGTKLQVTNLSNGREIQVTVNDWGPKSWTGKIIDLEKNAFKKLAPLKIGVIKVKIEKINN